MTLSEAIRESKARYDAGEREAAGSPWDQKLVAPSYHRPGRMGYYRWHQDWQYRVTEEEMLADDWERCVPAKDTGDGGIP